LVKTKKAELIRVDYFIVAPPTHNPRIENIRLSFGIGPLANEFTWMELCPSADSRPLLNLFIPDTGFYPYRPINAFTGYQIDILCVKAP
jgi:hypothetical protein